LKLYYFKTVEDKIEA